MTVVLAGFLELSISYSFAECCRPLALLGLRASGWSLTDRIEKLPDMNTEAPSDTPTLIALEAMVQRARQLYSLPAVAAEVIELTNCPRVDARALKDCIEVDPALTAKIMRVVNSSLFGLSREVVDLNQAIALLGTTPLKLLVLGFSLPENLFCEVAREQLEWYWSTTLARAVAAREISEQLWDRPGDDAFLVGLLQDIGVLVLIGELKDTYAHFLEGVIDKRADLKRLEVESLGFDHTALSAALLQHWKMPELLVESITEPHDYEVLKRRRTPSAELARILHLAELLAELVAQNRLGALPELLEAGEAYCGLNREVLKGLVASLQPKVQQLADVLSLNFCQGVDYSAIVTEAHEQMSEIAESVAEPLSRSGRSEEETSERILADVANLRAAVDGFLGSPDSGESGSVVDGGIQSMADGVSQSPISSEIVAAGPVRIGESFFDRLTLAVGRCRSQRQPISLLLLDVRVDRADDAVCEEVISQVLETTGRDLAAECVLVEVMSSNRHAFVLSGSDRQETVRQAKTILRSLEESFQKMASTGISGEFSACAGVAAVSLPVKNFPPIDLIETAERCLAAAQSTGTSVVKSLEIY